MGPLTTQMLTHLHAVMACFLFKVATECCTLATAAAAGSLVWPFFCSIWWYQLQLLVWALNPIKMSQNGEGVKEYRELRHYLI